MLLVGWLEMIFAGWLTMNFVLAGVVTFDCGIQSNGGWWYNGLWEKEGADEEETGRGIRHGGEVASAGGLRKH